MITVLCSTYNSSKWIEGYLESINNQILEEFDIVFVDANSDDGSLQTIKDYTFREGINKTVIESETRVPIYEAWNIAINKSTTPYVINVNTDDRLYEGALLTYLGYAKAYTDVDVFYSPYIQVDDENHSRVSGFFMAPTPNHEQLLKGCYCGPFPMLKKSTIIEDGLFNPEYTISGDYEMWLRMSKKGRKFYRIQECLGSYYNNPTGMSTNRESKHWNEHLRQDAELRRVYA